MTHHLLLHHLETETSRMINLDSQSFKKFQLKLYQQVWAKPWQMQELFEIYQMRAI